MGSQVSPDGRRIVKTGSDRTKNAAKANHKEVLRDYENGGAIPPSDYTLLEPRVAMSVATHRRPSSASPNAKTSADAAAMC
jgi:hypothetical protein